MFQILNANIKLKNLFSFISFVAVINGYSQNINVGLRTDASGRSFNDIYTPFSYQTTNQINIKFGDNYSENFIEGVITKVDGTARSGFIKIDDNNIYFRDSIKFMRYTPDEHSPTTKASSLPENISAKEFAYLTTKIDSFISSSNFIKKKKLSKRSTLIQYLGTSNGYVFGRYFKITFNDFQEQVFLVKENKAGAIWRNLYIKKETISTYLKYFGHVPNLKQKIESKSISKKDLPSFIQEAIIYNHHKEQSPIIFDQYWHKLASKQNGKSKAFVTDVKDSIYTLDYYQDSIIKYQVNYSNVYPKIKNGLFTVYNDDGTILKTVFFKDNDPKEVKIFHKNKTLLKHYTYTTDSINSPYSIKLFEKFGVHNRKYEFLKNSNNRQLLTFSDPITNEEYKEELKDSVSLNTFKIKNSDTIFQLNELQKLNLTKLQSKLKRFHNKYFFKEAIFKNVQGTVFISVTIDPKREHYGLVNSK